mmetsp:Transcript_86661/g.279910  ORF Transcript_86661/g.279910 Transcript_86661/m.279910 type:complete len:411 (+) Transcript_86661:1214-2446(+)
MPIIGPSSCVESSTASVSALATSSAPSSAASTRSCVFSLCPSPSSFAVVTSSSWLTFDTESLTFAVASSVPFPATFFSLCFALPPLATPVAPRSSSALALASSFATLSCSIFQEFTKGTWNFQRPAPYMSMRCAPSGKSFTNAASGLKVATSPTLRLLKLGATTGSDSKLTNTLLSPAKDIENGAPQVIISMVAFKSSRNRAFQLVAPLPRGISNMQATVFSGERPCSMNSSKRRSILLFSLRGSLRFFLPQASGAGSSPRTLVLPDMKEGVKDMTNKAFNFQASAQKRSSNFGSPSSASSTEPNNLSPACSKPIKSSTCLPTDDSAGTNFRIRCAVSKTELAKCTNRFGTIANFEDMLCEHLMKLLRVFSRRNPPRRPHRSTNMVRNSVSQWTKRLRNIRGSEQCPWSK